MHHYSKLQELLNTSAMLKSRYVSAGEFSEEEYIGQSIYCRAADCSAVQYGVSTLGTLGCTWYYCTSRLGMCNIELSEQWAPVVLYCVASVPVCFIVKLKAY